MSNRVFENISATSGIVIKKGRYKHVYVISPISVTITYNGGRFTQGISNSVLTEVFTHDSDILYLFNSTQIVNMLVIYDN